MTRKATRKSRKAKAGGRTKQTTASSILPQTIEYEGIGPVVFSRSARARRISLKIAADGRVRVVVPLQADLGQAREFVDSKRDWIARHLETCQKRLQVSAGMAGAWAELDIDEAAQKIYRRVQELARRFNFSFGRVTIRNQKTRWGSCSANNNLSLNIKLALLDEELMDLVLVHELLHTEIRNHGPLFRARMEELIPGAARLDQRLKDFSGLLLLPWPPVAGPRPSPAEPD